MSRIKKWQHDKEFDTRTLITNINTDTDDAHINDESVNNTKEPTDKSSSGTQKAVDLKNLSSLQKKSSEKKKTQIYEPRPLTPDDDIYEDILEQFASAPTKPKYWFEELGDYWSCSCGHINKGDICKSCGLERELLRSLFILHKPADEPGKLNKKLKKVREQTDKEALLQEEKDKRFKETSNSDINNIQPIETSNREDEISRETPEEKIPSEDTPKAEKKADADEGLSSSENTQNTSKQCEEDPSGKHDNSDSKKKDKKNHDTGSTAIVATPQTPEAFDTARALSAPAIANGKKKKKQIILIISIIIMLLLVSIGGFFVYKYLAAPAMKYEDAMQLQADGEYLKAIKKYEALGNYRDSENMIWECYICIGDNYFSEGNYTEAIETYNTALGLKDTKAIHDKIWKCYVGIGDNYFNSGKYESAISTYLDALDLKDSEKVRGKINDAKFGYVKSNKSKGGSKFENYMNELMEINYSGIREIYDEYYAWHITIMANNSESDFSTDMDTISRKDTAYFHITVRGGEPDEKINLFYEITWPNGARQVYDIDNEWGDGSQITARFQYPMPLFGKEGQLTFKLFDKSTQELLETDSITFKK